VVGGLVRRIKKQEGLRELEEHYKQELLHDLDNPFAIVKCAVENIRLVFPKPWTHKQRTVVDVAERNLHRLEKGIQRLISGPIFQSYLPPSLPKTLTPKEIIQNVLGNPHPPRHKYNPHS